MIILFIAVGAFISTAANSLVLFTAFLAVAAVGQRAQLMYLQDRIAKVEGYLAHGEDTSDV